MYFPKNIKSSTLEECSWSFDLLFRAFRWMLIIITSLTMGYILLVYLDAEGIYPPLKKNEKAYPLSNGQIIVKGTEWRHGFETGFNYQGFFQKTPHTSLERFGEWGDHEGDHLERFSNSHLVVILSPTQDELYVRTPSEEWKCYSMYFDPYLTFLSKADQQRIQNELSDEEIKWHPSVHVLSFDSTSLTLTASHRTPNERILTLKLSEDGTQLSLLKIEKASK
jgi:hypothetical protein